jgi:hypothetical protein
MLYAILKTLRNLIANQLKGVAVPIAYRLSKVLNAYLLLILIAGVYKR